MSAPYYQPGRYVCKITSQQLGESRTGNPQFVLRFKVLGVPDPEDRSALIPDRNQYERTMYRSITDKSIPYFMEDLQMLGFTGTSFKLLDQHNAGFQDFRGNEIEMICTHENDLNGQLREKWSIAKDNRVSTAAEVKPLESKKVRELDALFGKHLKGQTANGGPKPVPVGAAKNQNQEPSEDDVPF